MIRVENILTIIDIAHNAISPETLAFIQQTPTYRDTVLKEHIYDLDEDFLEECKNETVIKEVEELQDIMRTADAAYVRIIFS